MHMSEIRLEIAALVTRSFDAVVELLAACVPALAPRFGSAEYSGHKDAVQNYFWKQQSLLMQSSKEFNTLSEQKNWVNAGTAGLFEYIPEEGSSEDLAQQWAHALRFFSLITEGYCNIRVPDIAGRK